ncbi:hypothetical protein R3P38DRAFT_3203654 [Favolaschia claudopus]|uniref:Uncharacterized protein n=1 Tax=Favolaschia claudopus TaxID=2862362 RepID=A0AAW0ARB8_9AGAR
MAPDNNIWRRVLHNGNEMYLCNVCQDGRQRLEYNCSRHETTVTHQDNLQRFRRSSESHLAASSTPASETFVQNQNIVNDGLRNLLSSMTGGIVPPYSSSAQSENSASSSLGIDWHLMEANDDGNLSLSADQQAVATLAETILQHLDDLPESDEEQDERSEDDEDTVNEPELPMSGNKSLCFQMYILPEQVPGSNGSNSEQSQPRKRARTTDPAAAVSEHWFPWPDKITCTLDILMHLPRSVFSHRQLDLFLWLLKVNDVDDVPSVKSMQTINLALQKISDPSNIMVRRLADDGYEPSAWSGIYIETQKVEMANPKVRPHLHFYPEDSGPKLSEARQGERWLRELPDDRITPMARILGKDFYIHEPAILADGSAVIPVRWFMKDGQLYARCWEMFAVTKENFVGWRVLQRDDFLIPAREFLKDFVSFQQDAARYGLPHPSHIVDVVDASNTSSSPWKYTNPILGNPWRAKAQGHRVVTFPIWMYCDDTSGNLSKKWNEHNSFLMTPAGLPREQSQKEYNIHFLCTSNLARPLEMLDGIVEQLEEAQESGIWAWDMVEEEVVLVIPEVLALLGDNPMQSEFACHIGLRGKLFCRACWVKGTDAMDVEGDVEHGGRDPQGSDAGSVRGSDASDAESDTGTAKKGKGRKIRETMADMVKRVKAFVQACSFPFVGPLRNKEETTAKLRSYFTEASTLNTKTKVKNLQTESGVKDKYQTHFIEQLFNSYKGKRSGPVKQAALDAAKARLPPNTMSPVWRIKGLDPHQDTPVEILHVILLGFVKYLWRDLVQLQLNKKEDKKALLMTRLSSLDVSGLGISPLAGRTLVQYSGSLVGRDFRAIAQVAPFVVYDLVSDECFKTWQALSKLVPLVWQPNIENIDSHIALLTAEIENFLLCAARWTNRWFNKPKFHIIVHLPAHIRRFGPAILFATEAFESFNAIIRQKSVHSNRHAPSRDIAQGFAQGNRIRHLLSGGLFMPKTHTSSQIGPSESSPPDVTASELAPNNTGTNMALDIKDSRKHDWASVGPGARNLIASHSTVNTYLGLMQKKPVISGQCVLDKKSPRKIELTLAGQHLPSWANKPGLFRTCQSMTLQNNDVCTPGNFVIIRDPRHLGQTFVAQVREIIQEKGSLAEYSSNPDGILVQRALVNHQQARYGMPRLQLLDQWSMLETNDLLCTVNVQHNCMDHQCAATATQAVYQERTKTNQIRSEIAHRSNIDDVVLNTAQMRDAVHVQKFRVASEPLNLDIIVHASAVKEIQARKANDPTPSALLAGASPGSTHSHTPSTSLIPHHTQSPSSQSRSASLRLSVLQGPS